MDFFAHQDRARANTRRLYVLYLLALIAVVISLNVAVLLIATTVAAAQDRSEYELRGNGVGNGVIEPAAPWPTAAIIGVTSVASILVIGFGTLFKGCRSAATAQTSPNCSAAGRWRRRRQSGDERKLLNIVEEMAIASGMPDAARLRA